MRRPQGLKIFSLETKESWLIGLPDNSFFSDMTWSPDGETVAFFAHLPAGTQVWTADVESGKAGALNKAYVMATLRAGRGRGAGSNASSMLQWTSRGTVITFLVPDDRGPEPSENPVPASPLIRRTREKAAPTSTYPFLLRTQHDRELFRYYTTSQLAELAPGEPPRKIGKPAMFRSINLIQQILAYIVTRGEAHFLFDTPHLNS